MADMVRISFSYKTDMKKKLEKMAGKDKRTLTGYIKKVLNKWATDQKERK